ncbi:hypothetical protein RM550_27880 [Streptomyces sp. DSM 41527]|uniref:Extensin n=1 Tax=Streptomyces mooreae TaxID=3075523 RepID=A0ABU2TEY7_9ACTN|nr:hypothetical protein [Streptomyces sp. DSM 41527]MDT0459489.1 hypothetical protein [Streptomyces sp. DSM 41527]
MADDRYNWLDKDTAEQLLRGEAVSARHGDGARELEQLLEAAAAVAARTPETAQLPGEDAAVAAFRQAAHRASGARHRTAADPFPDGVRTAHTADLTERTRLGRPFRRGFAVALAACAIGGVAVAAGTGVLPSPFRGGDPAPASSVSAAETPRPFRTGEPGAQTDGTTAQTPDATPGRPDTRSSGTPTPGASPGAGGRPGGTPSGGTGRDQGKPGGKATDPGRGGTKNLLLTLCRNYESGKRGTMDRDTLRSLERKAGGPDKVHAFCRAYLARYQTGGGSGDTGLVGGVGGDTGGSGQSSGGKGGDEDDEGHPAQPPAATPGSGTSTPAPGPSATAPDPGNATSGGTADDPV